MDTLDPLEHFLDAAHLALKHAQDRERGARILQRWATAWQGPHRELAFTHSNHGAWLHFKQRIGSVWCQAFSFHAAHREGLVLRGPDTDRVRKSHKLRNNKLDSHPLDDLFTAWSAHPEAHPANNAITLFLTEAPDETWEACLQEALKCLK